MSHKRQVWETFSQLAQRLLAAADTMPPPSPPDAVGRADFDELATEVKRLGKAQFKANALQEATLEQLRETFSRLSGHEEAQREQAAVDAVHELLAALVPILDGLDAALASGERLLGGPAPDATHQEWITRHLGGGEEEEQAARLVSQSDRALLAAWLDGLRLVRDRLLAVLADAGVASVPTLGQPFDPHLHQAVGVAHRPTIPSGVIVDEQRRGYVGPRGVLRYAEVIVNRDDTGSGSADADRTPASADTFMRED